MSATFRKSGSCVAFTWSGPLALVPDGQAARRPPHEIVSVLYGQFLRVRVGAEWKQESQRLASWMQGGAS